MRVEWSSFGVCPDELGTAKNVLECGYEFYERHGIPRTAIKILGVNHYDTFDNAFHYEAEIEYDETLLTEDQLANAGIGDR